MRISRLALLALPVLLLSTTAPADAAPAAPVKAKHLLASKVTASAPTDGGEMPVSFRVNNRTGKAAKSSTAKAFLINASGRSSGAGTIAVPALAAGRATVVRSSLYLPAVAPGDYLVRVCLAPRPGGSCATTPAPVTVEAPPALVHITPETYDYGNVAVGASVQAVFTITSDSDDDLMTGGDPGPNTDYAFDFSGPFTCAAAPLPAHGSCTVTVTFAPQATGASTTEVMVFAGSETVTADLTGTGIACRACRAPVAPGARPGF